MDFLIRTHRKESSRQGLGNFTLILDFRMEFSLTENWNLTSAVFKGFSLNSSSQFLPVHLIFPRGRVLLKSIDFHISNLHRVLWLRHCSLVSPRKARGVVLMLCMWQKQSYSGGDTWNCLCSCKKHTVQNCKLWHKTELFSKLLNCFPALQHTKHFGPSED